MLDGEVELCYMYVHEDTQEIGNVRRDDEVAGLKLGRVECGCWMFHMQRRQSSGGLKVRPATTRGDSTSIKGFQLSLLAENTSK